MHCNMTNLIIGLLVIVVIAGCGDIAGNSSVPIQKEIGKEVALTTIPITDTTTHAKVFLGTDDRFTASNNGTTIYGGTGFDAVTIAPSVNNVTLDQNIEQINFSGAYSNYIFKQTGNLINIFDKEGTTLLAKAPVQGDSDGTILSLSDLLISAKMSTGTTGSIIQLSPIANPQVTIVTSKGTIVVELYAAKAPITVRNFLTYVNQGFYSSTLFHRVDLGFVVQGGGYSTDGTVKSTFNAITLEPPTATGLTNTIGTIAMARSTDLNSATSQFYFNLTDNTSLDLPTGQGYAVFGGVISGMDIVQQIGNTSVSIQSPISNMTSIISMTQTK